MKLPHIVLPAALLFGTFAAHAQEVPRWEAGGGFSYANVNLGSQAGAFSPSNKNYYGFDLVFGYSPQRHIRLVADVGFQFGKTTAVPPPGFTKVHLENTQALFGLQFTLRRPRTTAFASLLVGVNNSRLQAQAGTLTQDIFRQTGLALGLSGGVDVSLTRSLAIRAIEAAYVPVRRSGTWERQYIVSTGILYRFGYH
jgi:hypothetical protein